MADIPLSSLLGNALNISGGVLGSLFYQSAPNTSVALSPNTTTTRKYLAQTGTGSVGAAPVWQAIDAADIQTGTLNNARTTAVSTNTNNSIVLRDASGGFAAGVISGTRLYSGYDNGTTNAISCSGGFHSNGTSGWYNDTYGGGWYMNDTTYIRAYGSKQVSAADFVVSSDRRLKTDITPLVSRGRLMPVSFRWKVSGELDLGFIAQDVKLAYPEVVGEVSGNVELGQPDRILQLSYQKLTAVLAAQVNSLQDECDALRARLDALEQALHK